MQYRKFGKTGLIASVVGVGTWQLGGEWGKNFTPADADAIFNAARDCGINFIDTAECYGDHLSEQLIGPAIARDRDRWIVATKFGHKFRGGFERDNDYSAATMLRQLDDSLRALRTDRIDVYQVHGLTPESARDEELWEALVRQKEAGKIRHLGASVKWDASVLSRPELEGAQVIYNRLEHTAVPEVLPACERRGLGVIARIPLASGLLAGHYQPGHRWKGDDFRSTYDTEMMDGKMREVERIAREEIPEGVPMATWAISWTLRHTAVSTSIPGAKSADQVRQNAAAADLDIAQATHPQAADAPE